MNGVSAMKKAGGKKRDHKLRSKSYGDGAEVIVHARPGEVTSEASAPPASPTFYPDPGALLNYRLLPGDLRENRRQARFDALNFWLRNAGIVDLCRHAPFQVLPLSDFLCIVADSVASATERFGDAYGFEYLDLLYCVLTGGHVSSEPAGGGLAAYALKKSESDSWRQQLRGLLGYWPTSLNTLDADEIWQLLQQVSYAVDAYKDAGGAC